MDEIMAAMVLTSLSCSPVVQSPPQADPGPGLPHLHFWVVYIEQRESFCPVTSSCSLELQSLLKPCLCAGYFEQGFDALAGVKQQCKDHTVHSWTPKQNLQTLSGLRVQDPSTMLKQFSLYSSLHPPLNTANSSCY